MAFSVDERYFTEAGALTVLGRESGRWLDDERSRGVDWAELARELEVHSRVAEHLHRTWCVTGGGDSSNQAQGSLF